MTTPTTQPTQDLDTRAGAIENSGWGRSFTFYQPRNAAFWVYLALVVSGAVTFFSLLPSSAGAYGEAIALPLVPEVSRKPRGTESGRVEFARSEIRRIRSGQPSVEL